MEKKLQIELPLLLPHIEDERDQCVQRLIERLEIKRGVEQVHIDRKDGEAVLCLHYDPNLTTIEQLRRLAKQAGVEISRQFNHETLHITGMDCADCALSIEHILQRKPGVIAVTVNYAAEKMRIEYDTRKISQRQIRAFVRELGYGIEEERQESWLKRNIELVLSLLSGLFLGLGFAGEKIGFLPHQASILLYVLAYLTGGYEATRHGVRAALKLRFDIDFLMVVAAVGAAILGEWAEGALLLFLFSLGHSLEHFAMDRARNAIRALAQIAPRTARVQRDGQEIEVPVEELQRGDVVIVRPGERIPIDGKIIEGHSSIDESPITGESVPVDKGEGADVFAGTINGESALKVEVTRLARDTTLARVIQMVEEAQTQKSPTQLFTEKFERVFVPIVLGGVVIMIFFPPLVGWLDWGSAFLRAMTILVAASPCALAIATPSAILSGIARAAHTGVLIKGGVHLENLGALHAIAFDKTGTITIGRPEVVKVIPLNQTDRQELMRIAAAVESRSQHPLARAILRKAQAMNLSFPEAEAVQIVSGRGLIGKIDGQTVEIGNQRLFEESGQSLPEDLARQNQELQSNGYTTMLVRRNGTFVGIIALADQPRPDAAPTLKTLRKLGIQQLIMLTGDNLQVAMAIARRVGITEFQAGLLPQDKVTAIRNLIQKYHKVAMVGDGVNDAPALANATVGIAMGASGSDVALETADIALMADDLSKLPFAVALSRQTRRIIQQNLAVSLGVIFFLIIATLFGYASIGVAILFHEGSTLVVVANALRLLNFKLKGD
ncbi:MAG: cadmium-translocating P-type ATPase [Calditrichaeota bacterium]|nr:cadmium-translocating P-type ATPase [Calditrichota bacterium]